MGSFNRRCNSVGRVWDARKRCGGTATYGSRTLSTHAGNHRGPDERVPIRQSHYRLDSDNRDECGCLSIHSQGRPMGLG